MNRTSRTFHLRPVAAALLLLSMSAPLSAQTMKTKDTAAHKLIFGGQCVLTVPETFKESDVKLAYARRAAASPHALWANLLINAEVWWATAKTVPEPKVSYRITLGLQNPTTKPWTTPVKFVLTDVRQEWYPAETVAAPLSGAPNPYVSSFPSPIPVNLMPPPASVAPGATLMASPPVQHTVEWRKRPEWMVNAFDDQDRLLGSCAIADMKAVSRVIGPARDIEVLRNQPGLGIEDPEAASRPKPGPNWETLKSPQ